MNIKRQELNIALAHLTAWLLFFSALILLPLEEPRGDLVTRLALPPWKDPGELLALSNSRSSEVSRSCKAE